jgi:hypothetical protein
LGGGGRRGRLETTPQTYPAEFGDPLGKAILMAIPTPYDILKSTVHNYFDFR